jgi:hypothetical protein
MNFIIGILLLASVALLAFYLRKYKILSNLLLLSAATIGIIFLVEFIYRSFIRTPTVHTIAFMPLVKDSVLGLKIDKPGAYTATNVYENGDTVFNVSYTILSDTLETGPDSPFRMGYTNENSGKEFVFIGCSFTFGVGLNDEETLPVQFGKMTGVASVNRGIGSLGIHQVYESFRLKYAGHDNSNKTFIYSLLPDHFIRATGIYEWNNYGPYYIVRGDSLINTGVKEVPNDDNNASKPGFILKRLTFLKPYLQRSERKKQMEKVAPENMEPYFLVIKELSHMIKQSGGRLIILYWDDEKFEAQGIKVMGPEMLYNRFAPLVNENNGYIKRVSEIIDFDDERNFIKGDGHPAAEANRKIAEYLRGIVAN